MVTRELIRLGGLAGIGVALFILPFAASDGIIGGLFAPEVIRGASGEAWLARVATHPTLAQIAIALPIVGFALMLVVGVTLFRLVAGRHWGATLAIVGYWIGVSLAVSSFVSATSLVWSAVSGDLNQQSGALAGVTAELHRFMLVNDAVGPFFIIVVGNTCMSIAAWSVGLLPRWLCAWGVFNGALMALGIGSIWWPVLGVAQIGGPLTMLWFMATGISLLKGTQRGRVAAVLQESDEQ
jgi:hypothetical protein